MAIHNLLMQFILLVAIVQKGDLMLLLLLFDSNKIKMARKPGKKQKEFKNMHFDLYAETPHNLPHIFSCIGESYVWICSFSAKLKHFIAILVRSL